MAMYPYLKEQSQKALLEWWESLAKPGNLGQRARLARCKNPIEVSLTSDFHNIFVKRCPFQNDYPESSATLAGILSRVRTNIDNKTFAEQLGQKQEGSDKPLMSNIRFSKLLSAHDADEFYLGLLRAVELLGKKTNVLSLANSIIHWHVDKSYKEKSEPLNYNRSFHFNMAQQYYGVATSVSKDQLAKTD